MLAGFGFTIHFYFDHLFNRQLLCYWDQSSLIPSSVSLLQLSPQVLWEK